MSVLYNKGIGHIKTVREELTDWMQRHQYQKIADFKGKMSYKNVQDPNAYLRVQFMKYFAGIE